MVDIYGLPVVVYLLFFLQEIPAQNSKSSNSKSRSRLFRTPWRKKAKKSGSSVDEDLQTETSISCEMDDEVEESAEGFALITPRSLTEAEKERSRTVLKGYKFSWTSHRCLLEGLQGVTLRGHTIGSQLFLCCGATATGQPNTQVFYCSTQKINKWEKLVEEAPQYYAGSTIVNRELVLIGGVSSSDNSCSRLLSTYDAVEKTWVEVLPPLPTARSAVSATTWGDYLFVVGGVNKSGRFVDTVDILHLPSQQWHTAMPLPLPLAGASIAVYRSRLYVLGGVTGDGLVKSLFSIGVDRLLASMSRLNRFTSGSTVWSCHQDCPYTMMALCLFNGYMLALGGNESTSSISQPTEWIWAFFPDDESQNWTLVQKMNTSRKLCCATALSSSTLAVLGGNPFFSVIDVAQVSPGKQPDN